MNIKELQQLFMAKFDCYADLGGEDGPPAMTEKRFLEIISQNFPIEDNAEYRQFNKIVDIIRYEFHDHRIGPIHHDGA